MMLKYMDFSTLPISSVTKKDLSFQFKAIEERSGTKSIPFVGDN